MKFHETQFDEYIQSVQTHNIHPRLEKYWTAFPENVRHLCNLLFFGPSGVGKYSQMLYALHRYSASSMKYEKKLSITLERTCMLIKNSDIHYEVDMSLLGCNAKTVWHEIYQQIIAVISTKPHKCGIIVCKEFHTISADLLDVFFSYMQQNDTDDSSVSVKWALISNEISFIPDPILNQVVVISIPRPNKTECKYLCASTAVESTEYNAGTLSIVPPNLKDLANPPAPYYSFICDRIIRILVNSTDEIPYIILREALYDILIYHLNVNDCLQFIISHLIRVELITTGNMHAILGHVYQFLKLYNNNYRPIYHLERIMLYIVQIIHCHPVYHE